MGEKIVIGPINKGLRNDVTAFNIDDDSFPVLINAYQWRGRIKRKRGTSLLGRLTRYFNSANTSYGSITSFNLVAGAGNLLTAFSLESSGNIVPGTVSLLDTVSGETYTDPSEDGTLIGSVVGTGTINYATGDITIAGGAANAISTVSFVYYADLPVMGLEDLILETNQFPGTLAFDTKYSYNISVSAPYSIYDVSFYKNLASGTYTNYVTKSVVTPTSWNGADYQQFWTVNFQGALWATNGINIPFSITNIGMQFKAILTVDNITAGPPAKADLGITAHGLVIGDFVFINEVVSTTGINFQTGYVTDVVNANKVEVTFPNATIATVGTGGIAQYLTSRSDTTKDGIRWYDGDPTDANPTTPTLNGRKGWVNFAPPISQGTFSIADLPARQYYLVGARMIVPFKDRLLFLGPVVQSSGANSQIYLRDTVIYSQNGTPYYTASYTNTPSAAIDTPASASNVFNGLLVPTNQTATSPAYFGDQTGFGGFISAGLDQSMTSAQSNKDVLILGFERQQSRLIFTGNDIVPFVFYTINSEFGAGSTFSAISMDEGVISKGSRGYTITSENSTQRIDLAIPDEVFQVRLNENGTERVCAQRDFISEWIYFTYPSNQRDYKFPTQSLQYNYRDNTWAVFNESYTTYGIFRKVTGNTWATIGTGPNPIAKSWSEWNTPWNSGLSTLLQPQVIGGNQQGFVLVRDNTTSEDTSLYIKSFSGNTITVPNHCLNTGDYIVISECIGTISSQVNGKIFSVGVTTTDSFTLNPSITSGTYFGGGLITRFYVPLIKTKQFPVAWGVSRKTRLGPQQYLLTKTPQGQITLLVYLSQNDDFAYNDTPVVPAEDTTNDSVIYSTVLFTSPESTNLGLSPPNVNLNLITATNQQQIWHRVNTSLLGDTVQLGFTLSDAQMRDTDFKNQEVEIELHSIILDVTASMILA